MHYRYPGIQHTDTRPVNFNGVAMAAELTGGRKIQTNVEYKFLKKKVPRAKNSVCLNFSPFGGIF
jgi:hypothetical protein